MCDSNSPLKLRSRNHLLFLALGARLGAGRRDAPRSRMAPQQAPQHGPHQWQPRSARETASSPTAADHSTAKPPPEWPRKGAPPRDHTNPQHHPAGSRDLPAKPPWSHSSKPQHCPHHTPSGREKVLPLGTTPIHSTTQRATAACPRNLLGPTAASYSPARTSHPSGREKGSPALGDTSPQHHPGARHWMATILFGIMFKPQTSNPWAAAIRPRNRRIGPTAADHSAARAPHLSGRERGALLG